MAGFPNPVTYTYVGLTFKISYNNCMHVHMYYVVKLYENEHIQFGYCDISIAAWM